MQKLKSQQGMTLIEVLVAMAFVGIIMTAVLNAMTGSVRFTVTAKQRTQAIALAEELNEQLLRGQLTAASGTKDVNGSQYQWQLVDAVDTPTTVSYQLRVLLVRPDGTSEQIYELDSVRAR